MNQQPEESAARPGPGPEADVDRAIDDLRRGIERVREQVRTYRQVLRRDDQDDA